MSTSIPEEIQVEVLLRLPVKSISRFKCVCKRWHTYTTSPKFINDHLILAKKNPRIMIIDTNSREGENRYHIIDYDSISSALSSCKCAAVVPLNDPVTEKNGDVYCYSQFMGSCNGLLCLKAPGCPTPILWNPSTGEYQEIMPPTDSFGSAPNELESWWPASGFGYDGKIGDYKLICIQSNEVYVYTLKSGSWRKIVRNIPSVGQQGLLLNGALHWILGTSIGQISSAILAFDISSEKVMNFRIPEEIIVPTDRNSNLSLRLLGDSLCIVWGGTSRRSKTELWVMQDYGVTESWTKLFTTTQEIITKDPSSLKLYWDFMNRHILILVDGRFCLYDQKYDRIRFLNFNDRDLRGFYFFGESNESYVESLVSLNSGNYFTKAQPEAKNLSNKRRREEIKVSSATPVSEGRNRHEVICEQSLVNKYITEMASSISRGQSLVNKRSYSTQMAPSIMPRNMHGISYGQRLVNTRSYYPTQTPRSIMPPNVHGITYGQSLVNKKNYPTQKASSIMPPFVWETPTLNANGDIITVPVRSEGMQNPYWGVSATPDEYRARLNEYHHMIQQLQNMYVSELRRMRDAMMFNMSSGIMSPASSFGGGRSGAHKSRSQVYTPHMVDDTQTVDHRAFQAGQASGSQGGEASSYVVSIATSQYITPGYMAQHGPQMGTSTYVVGASPNLTSPGFHIEAVQNQNLFTPTPTIGQRGFPPALQNQNLFTPMPTISQSGFHPYARLNDSNARL